MQEYQYEGKDSIDQSESTANSPPYSMRLKYEQTNQNWLITVH